MIKVLYLTYDGLTDHLGQSQVIPYLKGLAVRDIEVHIISYEKFAYFKSNRKYLNSVLGSSNIIWHPLIYTKYPLIISTVIDLIRGFFYAYYLNRVNKYSFIHCRSQVPAVVGLILKKLIKFGFIIDMRGWWIEEKLDSGHWNKFFYLPIVHFLKWAEKLSFINCDQIVVLTHSTKKTLLKLYPCLRNKLTVIPTCTDVNSFGAFDPFARNQIRSRLGILRYSKVLIYSGSFGGNYTVTTGINIFAVFLKFFPDGHVIILSKTDPLIISEKLDYSIMPQRRIHIFNVNYSQVNKYLSAGDLGLILYADSWSNIGRSPTKLAEYWLCGLPVLAPRNIGDLEMLKSRYPFSLEFYEENKFHLINNTIDQFNFNNHRKELRDAATDYFGMKKGVDLYRTVYSKLLNDLRNQ